MASRDDRPRRHPLRPPRHARRGSGVALRDVDPRPGGCRAARAARAISGATAATTRSRISRAILAITPSASTCATPTRWKRPRRRSTRSGLPVRFGTREECEVAPRRAPRALQRPERQRRSSSCTARTRATARTSRPRGGHHRLLAHRTAHDRRRARRGVLDAGVQRARVRPHRAGAAPAHRRRPSQARAVSVGAPGRAARQSPGRGRRRRDARLLLPARARRADRVRTRAGIRRRRRSSCTSRDPTAWSTSIRPACA